MEELKNYCLTKLQSLESALESSAFMTPIVRLRMEIKCNVLRHLVDYENYHYFASTEEIAKYLQDNADIICGFYED